MMRLGIMDQTKVQKEINLEEVKNLTDNEKYNIKEYDNLRKTLNSMQKENFPYISFVLGGWKEIHEECYLQGIELVNHDKKKCLLCLEKTKKKNDIKLNTKEKNEDLDEELWKSEVKIKYKELNKLLVNKNNFLGLCTIQENQGKQIVNYDASIVLNEESSTFEIYKFTNRKHYNDVTNEYDKELMEKIQKIKDYYDLGKENNEDMELTLIEQIKISDILGMQADKKHKNILNINYRPEKNDKKSSKKKGNNNENIIKVDFPTPNDSKSFVKAFKNLMDIYRSKKDKK